MEYATFDETEFPIVKVTFHLKDPSLQQFRQFIAGQKRLLDYKKPFVLFMDARKVGFLSSEIRIEQGNFFKDFNRPLKEFCIGAILHVSSPLVSIMIKGMMLIAPPPNAIHITSDADDATKMAEDLLKKNNVPLPISEFDLV
jgi:hypothetical protein